MSKRIILMSNPNNKPINCDTVKLTREAVHTLQRLQLRTGLTARQLASEIITQSEGLVTVVDGPAFTEEDGENDD